ncbi:GAF and ANTAR domain-containing protein [Streptomyces sp. NPDC047070]|uniref:GAF and ANTAR domain-containing protein n=1 Tax=Streptomyces sp. NPDC047070 TaxID=3154923 RepID=UPI0034570A6C
MPATDREALVAEAVLDLAVRTDGDDVLDVLHDLTAHLVTLLGLRGAGVTILSEAGQADYLTASDEACRELEEDQREFGEGPCVDSARTASVMTPVSLDPGGTGPLRWPRFTPRALRIGIHEVAAVPLNAGEDTLGAVNLMSPAPGTLCAQDIRVAQVLADIAGARLRQRQTSRTRDEVSGRLQTALNTRIVIEQAKGVLAAHLTTDVHDAFTRMRAYARSRRENLSDVAAGVANGSVLPELTTPPRHAEQ